MKTPADFARIRPTQSVLYKYESETVAQNIMTILSRTGNTFRELTWDEYKTERLKDGNFNEHKEHKYFNAVKGFCLNADRAWAFSPKWRRDEKDSEND